LEKAARLGRTSLGSGRRDLDYLLHNIVDPNAIVDAAYYLNTINMKDGRVLSGIVEAQTERTLTLRAIGQETTLDKTDIAKREILPISLMPEALLQAFTPVQQRDLLAYLMSETGSEGREVAHPSSDCLGARPAWRRPAAWAGR
jgi:putative heme-binding domain-containing protein